MNVPNALLWSFTATIVLTTMMAGSQLLGLSRMSLPFLLGTIVTPDRDRAMLYGSGIHFVNGWLFALVYVAGFETLHRATWWLGALGGVVHGLFVLLVVLPLLPAVHPRMASELQGPTPTRLLQPPGFLAIHYGRRTPFIALLAHVAYGAVLGAMYAV